MNQRNILAATILTLGLAATHSAWTNKADVKAEGASSTATSDLEHSTADWPSDASALNLNHDQVREVQSALNAQIGAGLLVDGIMGRRTQEALRRFQSQKEIAASGDVTNETLFMLGLSFDDVYREPASVPEEETVVPEIPEEVDSDTETDVDRPGRNIPLTTPLDKRLEVKNPRPL